MEVHPPEHPIHTPRDFFLHLFTITIGLLIALSLEATVEWAHHRHQVAETRETLRREHDENLQAFAENTKHFRRETAALENDLDILQVLKQHPGTPSEKLPGVLVWSNTWTGFTTSAWKTAQSTGVTAFMPQDEVGRDDDLYSYLDAIGTDNSEYWKQNTLALSFRFIDHDPAHLTPTEIDHQIELTKDLVAAHYRRGIDMENMSESFKEFHPAPTISELNALIGTMSPEESERLATPLSLTRARIAQADKQ